MTAVSYEKFDKPHRKWKHNVNRYLTGNHYILLRFLKSEVSRLHARTAAIVNISSRNSSIPRSKLNKILGA